jgi:transposase-like protein
MGSLPLDPSLFRWIQAYAPELEKRFRPHLRTCNGSWRVDDTYVKVKGRWTYLYRAVDSRGQTIDDHRRIKRLIRPGLGFGSLPTARRTLAGYEGMAMIRKGQVRSIGRCEMRAQAAFIADLFGIAA